MWGVSMKGGVQCMDGSMYGRCSERDGSVRGVVLFRRWSDIGVLQCGSDSVYRWCNVGVVQCRCVQCRGDSVWR